MFVFLAVVVVASAQVQFFRPDQPHLFPQPQPQPFPQPQPQPLPQPQAMSDPRIHENMLNCGLTCSRSALFVYITDGVRTTVQCTDIINDPRASCAGCCAAKALAAGLSTTNAAAFPGTNGRDCICCINNNMCGFGGR